MSGQTYLSQITYGDKAGDKWERMFFQSTPLTKTFDCAHSILDIYILFCNFQTVLL